VVIAIDSLLESKLRSHVLLCCFRANNSELTSFRHSAILDCQDQLSLFSLLVGVVSIGWRTVHVFIKALKLHARSELKMVVLVVDPLGLAIGLEILVKLEWQLGGAIG
jgi:hypothetical protein